MFATTTRRVTVLFGTAALLSAGLATGLAAPAGAATASDEASFVTAWEDGSTTQIDLTANIDLTCPTGEPTRDSSTAIVVNGNGHTLNQSCDGGRVLEQQGEGLVTLQGITITGGRGGGGSGLDTAGSVVVTDSAFFENSAEGEGGAIQSLGTVTITGSQLSDNFANGSGGAVAAQGLITLTSSTVSDNTSDNNGGGFRAYGGARVVNSTMTGNVAEGGGAVDSNTDVELVYATVTDNTGAANVEGDGVLTSFASVVALPGSGPNCIGFSSTTSGGYDIDDDGSCGFGAGPGDHSDFSTPLQLAALGDNGGPTPTQLPATGSPLLNAVPTGSCQSDGASGITTDQRGITRPQGTGCDIGAVEVQVAASPTSSTTSTTAPSNPAAAVEATPAFTG